MFCKNCGKNIADNSLECEHCGEKQLAEENNNENNNVENDSTNEVKNQSSGTQAPYYTQQASVSVLVNKSEKRIFIVKIVICAIGIFMGALLLINGFIKSDLFFGIHFHSYGDYVTKAVFGADFYTEIHDATRLAANNICDVISSINNSLQTFAIAFGSFMVLISSFALCITIEKRNKN